MSQAHRNPMLLFEFEAALFQFDVREPEFAPLFQLPPKIAALCPGLPLLPLALDPRIHHAAHFRRQRLRRLQLVMAHAALSVQESHPETEMRQARIRRVNSTDLIRFPGLEKQIRLSQQTLKKQIAGDAMLARHRLSDRVQIGNDPLVLFDDGKLVVTRKLLARLSHVRALPRP